MNVRITLVLALGAALLAPAMAAPQNASDHLQAGPAIGYWATSVKVAKWSELFDTIKSHSIRDGSPRWSVVSALGQPAREWSAKVWLYRDCRPDYRAARRHGCDLLVMTFADGRVASMRFVNRTAVAIIAANAKAGRARLNAEYS